MVLHTIANCITHCIAHCIAHIIVNCILNCIAHCSANSKEKIAACTFGWHRAIAVRGEDDKESPG